MARRRMSLNFGSYIKELRIGKNNSLKQIEEVTGISASYLNRIENGQRKCVSLPIIESLAKAYGRSALELVEVALNNSYNSEELPLLETIIYNNSFIINSKEADKEVKDALVSLIRCVVNLNWTSNSKFRDSALVLEEVENLKLCLT